MVKRRSEMKIDLAVYTAVTGYDWQPGTLYDKKQLDTYRNVLRSFGSQNNTAYAKIFIHEDKVVFARFFIAEGIEQSNRRANYIILGTVEINRANEIDFMHLLSMEEISKPVPPPFPSSMEYKGDAAKNITQLEGSCTDKRFRGELLQSLGVCAQNAESLFVEVIKENSEIISIVTHTPKPKKPTLTLAKKMVLTEDVLQKVFSLFAFCNNAGIGRRCQDTYSLDSIPSDELSRDIRRGFENVRNKIGELQKNLKKTQDEKGEIDKKLYRVENENEEKSKEIERLKNEIAELNKSLTDKDNELDTLRKDLVKKNKNTENSLSDDSLHNKECELHPSKIDNKKTFIQRGRQLLNKYCPLSFVRRCKNGIMNRFKSEDNDKKEADVSEVDALYVTLSVILIIVSCIAFFFLVKLMTSQVSL